MMRVSTLMTVVVCLGCSAAFALELSTLEIYLSVEQGVVYTESLVVTNDSDEEQQVMLYVGDWDRDEGGQNRFYMAGTIDRGLTPWMSLVVPSFSLAPGASQTVTFHVAIPAIEEIELDGSYWGMIFVELAAPAPDVGAGGVVVSALRYGVKVYATIAGTQNSAGVVRSVSVEQGPEQLLVTVQYENTGNVIQNVIVRCDVVDRTGRTCRTSLLESCPLLPAAFRTLEISLDPLETGLYQAVAQVDYGGIALVGGVRAFRIR